MLERIIRDGHGDNKKVSHIKKLTINSMNTNISIQYNNIEMT